MGDCEQAHKTGRPKASTVEIATFWVLFFTLVGVFWYAYEAHLQAGATTALVTAAIPQATAAAVSSGAAKQSAEAATESVALIGKQLGIQRQEFEAKKALVRITGIKLQSILRGKAPILVQVEINNRGGSSAFAIVPDFNWKIVDAKGAIIIQGKAHTKPESIEVLKPKTPLTIEVSSDVLSPEYVRSLTTPSPTLRLSLWSLTTFLEPITNATMPVIGFNCWVFDGIKTLAPCPP